ncbi:MAG: hypothetical protein H5T41_03655 [Methanomassiliicoccales archaeon]|jgi:hypothetical protein|nr:hypothetical protein [Methanomassiliicoccales archaeon]
MALAIALAERNEVQIANVLGESEKSWCNQGRNLRNVQIGFMASRRTDIHADGKDTQKFNGKAFFKK